MRFVFLGLVAIASTAACLCSSGDQPDIGADEKACVHVDADHNSACDAGFTCIAFPILGVDPAGTDLCGRAIIPPQHANGALCVDCAHTLEATEQRACSDPNAQDPEGLTLDEFEHRTSGEGEGEGEGEGSAQ